MMLRRPRRQVINQPSNGSDAVDGSSCEEAGQSIRGALRRPTGRVRKAANDQQQKKAKQAECVPPLEGKTIVRHSPPPATLVARLEAATGMPARRAR
jgi:hypothetical protein